MTTKPKIHCIVSMARLVTRLRDDLSGGNQDFVLLYAYNGTGKTRLSMAFKDAGKRTKGQKANGLYFNVFNKDLISWDNDLAIDTKLLFRQILIAFLDRYKFALPDIFERPAANATPTP